MAQRGSNAGLGAAGATLETGDRTTAHADAAPGAAGVSLGQRSRSAPVWPGLRAVDARRGGRPDRAQIGHQARRDGSRRVARQAGTDTAKAAATGLSAGSRCDRALAGVSGSPPLLGRPAPLAARSG